MHRHKFLRHAAAVLAAAALLAAVVLAVYNPVRQILMQPITATISEL